MTHQDMSEIKEWKEHSYYVVEAAFSETNPLHRYVFFTGFLNGKDNTPGGYNMFCTVEDPLSFVNAIYIKPIQFLYQETNFNLVEPLQFAKDRINGSNT